MRFFNSLRRKVIATLLIALFLYSDFAAFASESVSDGDAAPIMSAPEEVNIESVSENDIKETLSLTEEIETESVSDNFASISLFSNSVSLLSDGAEALYTDEETGTAYYTENADTVIDLSTARDSSVVMYVFSDGIGVIDGTGIIQSGYDNKDMSTRYLSDVATRLTKVVVTESSSISTDWEMGAMFYGCSNLVSADLSLIDTTNMQSTYEMFDGCSSLATLNISSWDTSNVSDMAYMFKDCSSLTVLDLSNFNTSNVGAIQTESDSAGSMYAMFQGCSGLTELNVSNFDTSNVVSMGFMFCDCTSLTSLDVSNFDTSKVKNMNSMFSGCTKLTTLNVSNFDTSNVTAMNAMFYNCSNLTELDLSSFTIDETDNVTSFAKACPKLTNIIIGENVKYLGTDSFYVNTTTPITTRVHSDSGVVPELDWEAMNRRGEAYLLQLSADNKNEFEEVNLWNQDNVNQEYFLSFLTESELAEIKKCKKVSFLVDTKTTEPDESLQEYIPGYELITTITPTIDIKIYGYDHKEETAQNKTVSEYLSPIELQMCGCAYETPFYDCEMIALRSCGSEYEIIKDVEISDAHIVTFLQPTLENEEDIPSYTLAYILKPNYTVNTSEDVSLDSDGSGAYEIQTNGNYQTGSVAVVPEVSFMLSQTGKEDVAATVTQSKSSFSLGEKTTGQISAPNITAGKWTGSFDLEISTSYSDEEWKEYLSLNCPNYTE